MARENFAPVPRPDASAIRDPVIAARTALGHKLFFDSRLSSNGRISCSTCHNLARGGASPRLARINGPGREGQRNVPSVFNATLNHGHAWDGRTDDVESQVRDILLHMPGLAGSAEAVVTKLQAVPGYATAFAAAFPGSPEPITFEHTSQAIEAFLATLLTPDSRFDQFLRGNLHILTAGERAGLAAFMAKGCATCHNGVNLGGQAYYPFGVFARPDPAALPADDRGRYAVTSTSGDEYVFRAPPLRNVALTAPYFHAGGVADLRSAVAIMSDSQLGGTLTDQEITDITAFLETLTGTLPDVTRSRSP